MHPSQLAAFSEGYVDQITALKAEIESYRPGAKKNGAPADTRANESKRKRPQKRQKTR